MPSPNRKPPSLPLPTAAELDILAVLWRLGAATVREVHEELGKDNAYTTTLKQMQLMTEKGLLLRSERFGSHVYEAGVPKEQTQQQIAGDLLKRAFDGSAGSLLLGALSAQPASPAGIGRNPRNAGYLRETERTIPMNPIQILSSQPWVERLGWTLVHFLWQGSVDRRPVRRRTQSGETHFEPEHPIPAGLRGTRSHDGRSTRHVEPDAAVRRGCGLRLSHPRCSISRFRRRPAMSLSVRTTASSVEPAQLLPWVVAIWLIGAMAFWVRLAGGWVVAARMRSMLVRPRRRNGSRCSAGSPLASASPAPSVCWSPPWCRCRRWSAGCGPWCSSRWARSAACLPSTSKPSSCTNWRTSAVTIIWSTSCRASPRRCSSTTRRSGGSPDTSAASAKRAATTWPSPSQATC